MTQFDKMTEKELRDYIRKNPTDDAAIRVRIKQIEQNPQAVTVPYGTSGVEIERILRKRENH